MEESYNLGNLKHFDHIIRRDIVQREQDFYSEPPPEAVANWRRMAQPFKAASNAPISNKNESQQLKLDL